MIGVPVELLPASPEADLVPVFDADVQLLGWAAGATDDYPQALNIGNLVIIDCNEDGLARFIELIIPEPRWTVTAARPLCETTHRYALRLSQSVLDARFVLLPLIASRSGSVVYLDIGEGWIAADRCVALSAESWAWLKAGELVGLAGIVA